MQNTNITSINIQLETLKNRYAKGEINRDEFEQMKKDIKGENEPE